MSGQVEGVARGASRRSARSKERQRVEGVAEARVEGVADIDSNICTLSVQRSVLNYV